MQQGTTAAGLPRGYAESCCPPPGPEYIFVAGQCIVNRPILKKPSAKSRRRGIQSIETGVPLLEALERAGGPLALKELSARAGLDPSGAHRYLASFMRCGLVAQRPDSRYEFGPLALRLGLAAIQRADPIQATEGALPALVDATGFTALLAVWSNRGPTVVHWQRIGDLVTSLNLGSVLPVARSSLGRMLLAFLPAGVTAEALALEARKEKLDRDALERELERARKSRLAYADKTVIPGLYAAASVVRGWNGEAVAAVALIGADAELARQNNPAALKLRELCDRLSADAGFSNLKIAA
ncbi:MAG TPA: IclR family transcriptional regulator [Burkholderiales bacterium]